jgi:hypothetical protein
VLPRCRSCNDSDAWLCIIRDRRELESRTCSDRKSRVTRPTPVATASSRRLPVQAKRRATSRLRPLPAFMRAERRSIDAERPRGRIPPDRHQTAHSDAVSGVKSNATTRKAALAPATAVTAEPSARTQTDHPNDWDSATSSENCSRQRLHPTSSIVHPAPPALSVPCALVVYQCLPFPLFLSGRTPSMTSTGKSILSLAAPQPPPRPRAKAREIISQPRLHIAKCASRFALTVDACGA